MLAEGVRALAGHPVTARCTVQARNCRHLYETVGTARALGLRSISFLMADVTSARIQPPAGVARGEARCSRAGVGRD